jgi:hypothetical protein
MVNYLKELIYFNINEKLNYSFGKSASLLVTNNIYMNFQAWETADTHTVMQICRKFFYCYNPNPIMPPNI